MPPHSGKKSRWCCSSVATAKAMLKGYSRFGLNTTTNPKFECIQFKYISWLKLLIRIFVLLSSENMIDIIITLNWKGPMCTKAPLMVAHMNVTLINCAHQSLQPSRHGTVRYLNVAAIQLQLPVKNVSFVA
ncbi:hypothetical protein CANARDRAFT_65758 [[Candida] arabinofermentans NRRL YB-2248]|uniref:Uncharacterized protein n=1 Tax=[Candida] arabinofermentans NRRL YB-2248 TaxID=983967 RepID=A0A1E4SY11_9ASCO|nr:hypothetical protein CANARDRAFT_65758 [[Candida] arabinofermentans NRRL YB-2248]